MKKWKEMNEVERKAHVKKVSEEIILELQKEYKENSILRFKQFIFNYKK